MGGRWGIAALAGGLLAVTSVTGPARPAALAQSDPAPVCDPDGAPVVHPGTVGPADAKTYRTLPFDVAPDTTRIEVGYEWSDEVPLPDLPVDLVQTVLDLGLWDPDGVGTPEGFRGWSGSRQGRTAAGQDPVWVQADTAERGYLPGPIEPGVWHVDLGVASVVPLGATYEVTVRCLDTPTGPPFVAQPVDPDHVASTEAGWYHADFHMHGRHSHPQAPDWPELVDHARAAGLDVLPITDYVTTQHHRELGPVQAANPDLLIWPSREVITYFGHATVFGETPSVVDWRHGAPGVSLGAIQAASRADGALFGVAHPTTFPTEVFAAFCRGCEFTLDDEIDWDAVDTMEVVSGPVLVDDTQLGGPGLGIQVQNPFTLTARAEWQQRLLEGHRITAVSGSDDKLGPGFGSSATAVFADELSVDAVAAAIRQGRAYVRTRGVDESPELDLTATTADGQTGTFGATLHAPAAEVTVRVRGGAGQLLLITSDGLPAGAVPVTSDDFSHTFTARRGLASGPLGTFWRVDTLSPGDGTTMPHLTTVGNPVFLAEPRDPGDAGDPGDPGVEPPGEDAMEPVPPVDRPGRPAPDQAAGPAGSRLPATGGGSGLLAGAAVGLLAAVGLGRLARR